MTRGSSKNPVEAVTALRSVVLGPVERWLCRALYVLLVYSSLFVRGSTHDRVP